MRLRGGQHADRGRVVLHLGEIPAYSLRRLGQDHELRLRGAYRIDQSGLRRPRELAGVSVRQDAGETVLRLHGSCDCTAESGAFDGMLYVDLRPAAGAPSGAELAPQAERIEAARRRLLEDAVRLGLLGRDQAEALLRGAPPPAAPTPVPLATPTPVPLAATAPAPPPPVAPPVSAPAPAAAPPLKTDDLAALRDAMTRRLALLNGAAPPAAAPLPTPTLAAPLAAPPAPEAAPEAPPDPVPMPPVARLACPAASFSMAAWKGDGSFTEGLAPRRAALARTDQGPAELAALAEFYVAHELPREALSLLSGPLAETPGPLLRARLERARDMARLLARQPIDPASPLLAEAADCAWPDLPLWQGLAAALGGDGPVLSRLAPRIRGALRDLPPDLRLAFVGILADAAEEDAETLRGLLGAIRTLDGLRPDQRILRHALLARLARLEGNRADEVQHLERAVAVEGFGARGLPAQQARLRLAALRLGQPGPEAQQAELLLQDASRTYRFDPLGEEAAVLYAERLLERGDIGGALAVADGAGMAALRPGMDSRGARLAAGALRRLLLAPRDGGLPPPADRLALYWQYEGYATPGERGDDIRLGALRLMLEQGLADAALDTGRQLTPATAQRPEAALLLARAEAGAAQGDAQRALALLAPLPPGTATRQAASAALLRLGRPLEAARALEGLPDLADRQQRAALLFQAQDWVAAAEAYAALLRDPALEASPRAEAAARLASAAALARQRPGIAPDLLAGEPAAENLLRLTAEAPPERGVAGARAAIARSRRIEQLLPERN
ncbi:MAG: hypothetical protein DI635_12685 [Pseudoxanthomonas suwonensis]|nr:MAG: hypothetical protein DI635_12685 [Pseudoxanthomonas suwonensis]